MIKARNQPFCGANIINQGYFDGTRVFPRSVTDRDNALFSYKIHFCLLWKSEKVSFNQAIKKLKDSFKIVDFFITEENVNSHFNYEFMPNKIELHLTNFILYDLETHNTDKVRPCNMSFYRLSKLAGRYKRNLIPCGLEIVEKAL